MNNKKTIITLILILFIGIIGLTVAYFSNSTTIDNLFSTKEYSSTITEIFTSPNNWLPGDETEKKVVATNTGEVDQAVRISYTEKWLSTNNNELNGWIHEDGTKSNHETELELNTDERVALINFDNNDDWTYNNGYYYYNYRLQPNESTSSLIKSVSFNSKTKLDDTCTTTISEGKKTITCNSSGDNYDGATYTLTFIIETVQFDKYMNAWNTDVAILNEQALFCDAFEVGEVVEYNNAEYYVLKDSSTSDDYVTLLKKDPLTASEVNQYSTDYLSQDGEYPYYESDTCNENTQTGCSTNYDTSDVKKILDGWSSSFSDDLVSVDGYKTRLIGENDFDNLKIKIRITYRYMYYIDYSVPYMVYKNINNYWTTKEFSNNKILEIDEGKRWDLYGKNVYEKSYIRPVINLKKSIIQGNCFVNNNEYLSCALGDEVTYNNEKYYVLEDSNSNMKIVTLLKKDVLTADEINKYSTNYVSLDGEYPYYESDICNENDQTECNTNYNTSNVKSIIDSWSNSFNNDLSNIDGYKARLVNDNDIINKLNYESYYASPYDSYRASSDTPKWVYISGKEYWSMTNVGDTVSEVYGVSNVLSSKNIYNKLYIRPVINLKKSAIESGCHLNNNNTNYTTYSIGETISYNNSNYCVINNSKISDDYVTLIKQEPLTYDELVTYNNGYQLGRDSVDNNIGTISYYKSDTCYYNLENDKNTTGCSNNYDNSFIKNILNNWSNSFNSDLEEVNGYKVRLINNSELNSMGHQFIDKTSATKVIKSDYDCLYSDAEYWTMSTSNDSIFYSDIVSKTNGNNGYQYVDKRYAVRPVINLKKCAIDNTCE